MKRNPGPGVLWLLDQAFTVLLDLPAAAWLWWASGAMPFLLLLIGFVTVLTGTVDASAQLALWSLLLAVSYVWLGIAQTRFSSYIGMRLSGESGRTVPMADLVRTAAFLQASGAVLIPLAALTAMVGPAGFAFFQCAAAYPYGRRPATMRDAIGFAMKQCAFRPMDNLLLLLILALLWLLILVNLAILALAGPTLFRALTGVENEFTRQAYGMANLTTVCAVLLTTWACLDPVVKAVYAVRCFYVEAVETGADLRAVLAGLRAQAHSAAAALLLFVFATSLPAQSAAIAPADLQRSIRQASRSSEYRWRAPSSMDLDWASKYLESLSENLRKFLEFVFGMAKDQQIDLPKSGEAAGPSQFVLFSLGLILAGWLIYMARLRKTSIPVVEASPHTAQPVDLTKDDVMPDQLPGAEWFSLADQYLAAGDLRMACRAVFLGLLAALGAQGRVSIHRGKSNLDYLRELARRTRGETPLHDSVREVIRTFERSWYGEHPLTRAEFDAFRREATEASSHAQ